jgi:hypothetical protein
MAPLQPMKTGWPERRPDPIDTLPARLRAYSRLGVALAVLWLVVSRPFWRHFFVTLSAMAFATFLLPKEMMFFARHPVLLLALPFTAGYVAANLGRSSIGTVAACVVVVVLAVAVYRMADVDPVTSAWLQPRFATSTPHPEHPGLNEGSRQ